MRHFLIPFLLLISSSIAFAQFSGENLRVLGIYKNNLHIDRLSLHLENTNAKPDSNVNGQVYTQIGLISAEGDTLLLSFAQHSLPTIEKNKLIYQIPLHPNYAHIADLPDYRCGTLFTHFPAANVPYCIDSISENEEIETRIRCSDYQVEGIYQMGFHTRRQYSLLIRSQHPDSLKTAYTGYTSFQLFDADGQAISDATSPSYALPQYFGEIYSYPITCQRALLPAELIKLRLKNPDCEFSVIYNLVSDVSETRLSAESPKVYPNPVQDQLTIESETPLINIQLFDMKGRLLHKSHDETLNLSEMPAGLYWLRIQVGQGVWVRKVAKEIKMLA